MATAANNDNTDLDALNDVIGAAGVDLNAEEERMRSLARATSSTSSTLGSSSSLPAQSTSYTQDRRRKQNFVEQDILEKTMTSIASIYRLRNIEPDALPLIALAAQQRLRGLIDMTVKSRQHRLEANSTRPPPVHPMTDEELKRRAEDEEMQGIAALWDQVVVNDAEMILRSVYRIEKEEEMKERRARTARDNIEREELRNSAAAAEQAGDATPSAGGKRGRSAGTGSGGGVGEDGKREKKRKKESKSLLSEDQAKKFSDATAKAMTGGLKYSWLSAGAASSTAFTPAPALSLNASSAPSPSSAANSNDLPKPKFTPQPGYTDNFPSSALLQPSGGNLAGWSHTPEPKKLILKDLLFAYDQERGGGGAGRGTGSKPVFAMLARRPPSSHTPS